MDEYIKQLTELLTSSHRKQANIEQTPCSQKDNYINEFADQYINGTPQPISKLTGIESYQFPPVEKLTAEQISSLTTLVESLLESYHLEFVFPEHVTDLLKYDFITKNWDSKHVHCEHGMVQIETCKFDDDDCPFPGHCSVCEDFKQDCGHEHALCKGQVDFNSLMPAFTQDEEDAIRQDVEQFKKLIRSTNTKGYITGIHNYCDGRCHLCDFTERCSSYSINQELEKATGDAAKKDSSNQLMVILKATTEIIEEELSKQGINPEDTLKELATSETLQNDQKHPLQVQGESYAEKVKRWLDSNQREMESRMVDDESDAVNMYFASITWFQLFIPAKISRACSVFNSPNPCETELFDSDGSAKAALLGMDESIWAWENLMHVITKKEDSILNILRHLSKLRTGVEEAFPKARSFVRPGFDAVDE